MKVNPHTRTLPVALISNRDSFPFTPGESLRCGLPATIAALIFTLIFVSSAMAWTDEEKGFSVLATTGNGIFVKSGYEIARYQEAGIGFSNLTTLLLLSLAEEKERDMANKCSGKGKGKGRGK